MLRPSTLLVLGGLALQGFAAPAAFATTIPPDSTSPPLDAIRCIANSGSLENVGDLNCPLFVCSTDCEESANKAKVGFNVSNFTIGRRFVENTVITEFTVDAGTDGAGHELDATIAYDVEWNGLWTLAGLFTGFNDVEATISLLLWDVTSGGNRLVRQVELHHLDAEAAGGLPQVDVELGIGLDLGGTSNTLTAKVIRGRDYRIGLKIRAQGKGAANASVNLDYLGGEGGAWWNELTVAISPDLEERVDELERRVTILEELLQHHTHQYLTGRGEGHNNTPATTSEPIFEDSGEPTEEEAEHLPLVRPRAQPLPVRSFIETDVAGPPGPVATIRYTLPEPLPVSIRIYDPLGRVISNLVDGQMSAGTHEVRLDASHLSSGVYYYRLVAGRFAETRKLTLLK